MIDGYKTYIGIIAGGILGLVVALGWATWDQVDWIGVVVAAWTGVAVTHKVDKAIAGKA
jgi:predicted negative regulator of RcsB-dependent stress response